MSLNTMLGVHVRKCRTKRGALIHVRRYNNAIQRANERCRPPSPLITCARIGESQGCTSGLGDDCAVSC